MLNCPCGQQYIGRTIRKLQNRVKEHLANIRSGFPGHSVSKHYAKYHGKNLAGTIIIGIDHVHHH